MTNINQIRKRFFMRAGSNVTTLKLPHFFLSISLCTMPIIDEVRLCNSQHNVQRSREARHNTILAAGECSIEVDDIVTSVLRLAHL